MVGPDAQCRARASIGAARPMTATHVPLTPTMSDDGLDLPFALEALREWLDQQGVGSGDLEHPTLLAGGTQNILLRFDLDGRSYVLRHPPRHLRENSSEAMRREARVLGALSGTDVPHPRLIAACDDEEVLGAAFYVMENIDGFNATAGLPELHAGSPEIRRQMGLAAVEGAAALSLCDYKALGLEGFGKPDGFLERQVSRWKSQLQGYAKVEQWPGPSDLRGVDDLGAWLDANVPSDYRPGVIHGDYHLANVMFRNDGPSLAAVIDWELSTIGDPLVDLGWLITTWPDENNPTARSVFRIEPWQGFPSVDELVAHYGALTGRDLSSLDWYFVLACYKLGILLEGTYVRSCAGKADQVLGERLHQQAIDLFSRALDKLNGKGRNREGV